MIKERQERIEYTYSFKVNRSAQLLEFLLSKVNTSRNNVKNILKNRMVLVNGTVVTQFDFSLAKDDEVKISKRPIKDNPVKKEPVKKHKKQERIEIIFENEDFIAIDKPQGLLSVQSDKDRESAYSYVYDYLKDQGKNVRPYSLHRIDKETSGVLVFTKNIKIHSMLKLNWNDYVVEREYYAVVSGKLDNKQGTIKTYLKENSNNLMYVTDDKRGQLSITNYEVVRENNNYSLVRVTIDTGRKNQIRVHFSHMGHPVVGDDKYGNNKSPINRLCLHASKLVFINPITKEEMEFKANVPSSFYTLFPNKK